MTNKLLRDKVKQNIKIKNVHKGLIEQIKDLIEDISKRLSRRLLNV